MKHVRIHIDQRPYESPDPTTGEALYRLGQVQADMELYREVRGNREDPPVEYGPEVVQLRDDEHFHSGPRKQYTVVVNGRKKTVTGPRLTFDALVALAFNPVPNGPNVKFTVTYGNGPKQNPEGTLLEGGSVKIQDGMVFSVTATDKS